MLEETKRMRDDLLVVIPARGGSRRLPRKAMRTVAGRPLIWYTLDYTHRIGLADKAVVVTDDDEIADYTLNSGTGVGVVREPPIGAEGECSSRAVYRAVTRQSARGRTFDIVVEVAPTCPVRPLGLVQRCVDSMVPDVDGVVSVQRAPLFLAYLLRLGQNNRVLPFEPLDVSDNLEPVQAYSGCVFAFWRRVYSTEPTSYGDLMSRVSLRGVVHEGWYCDIDHEAELEWFKYLVNTGRTIWRLPHVDRCRQ